MKKNFKEDLREETVFEGYVNDTKFDNKEAMDAYLDMCTKRGIPISNLKYSQTTSYHRVEQPKVYDWSEYIRIKDNFVPKPYDTVINYVVPFVEESLHFNNEQEIEQTIKDIEDKLNKRLEFIECIFDDILHTNFTDDTREWLESLLVRLEHKHEWCTNRITYLNGAKALYDTDPKFNCNFMNTMYINGYLHIYSNIQAFVAALIDIAADVHRKIVNK